MFPRLMQHYRQTRDDASQEMSSLPYGAVQSSQTRVLDDVAPIHGRGLTQVEAVTGQDPNEYGILQWLQHLIDAEIAQYCTAFDEYPLPDDAVEPEPPQPDEPPSEAVQNGPLEPVDGEQQSSGSVPSSSRGSSTTPPYTSGMASTPVEETYDGPWNDTQAYNELTSSKFSTTRTPNTCHVNNEEQNASSNALPMRCIDPELLKVVPPSCLSLSSGIGLNVVETVLPTALSTESDVWRIEFSSRKRKRVDGAVFCEASPVSAENANGKGKTVKNAKYKLVLADGRPLSALPLRKIIEALGLTHVNPPGTTFKCVVPGCNTSMLESKLLGHFGAHAVKEGRTACPVCTRAFNTSAAFKRHLRDVHLRAQEMKCSVCGGKVNREADDQIRRHLNARKHEDAWKLLGLIRVKDDGVFVAKAKDGAARLHESEEDDRGEGSSKGVKRQRYS